MTTVPKASILYLDDETMCLDVFHQTFEPEYEVRVVSSPDEARVALNERKYDVVISDQLMPEIDGVTFLNEVSQNHPHAFRIMLTGSISVGQVIGEISGGVIHLFVTKPWTEPEMRRALERAVLNRSDSSRTPNGEQSKVA